MFYETEHNKNRPQLRNAEIALNKYKETGWQNYMRTKLNVKIIIEVSSISKKEKQINVFTPNPHNTEGASRDTGNRL